MNASAAHKPNQRLISLYVVVNVQCVQPPPFALHLNVGVFISSGTSSVICGAQCYRSPVSFCACGARTHSHSCSPGLKQQKLDELLVHDMSFRQVLAADLEFQAAMASAYSLPSVEGDTSHARQKRAEIIECATRAAKACTRAEACFRLALSAPDSPAPNSHLHISKPLISELIQ